MYVCVYTGCNKNNCSHLKNNNTRHEKEFCLHRIAGCGNPSIQLKIEFLNCTVKGITNIFNELASESGIV